jgi:hypothetical protein
MSLPLSLPRLAVGLLVGVALAALAAPGPAAAHTGITVEPKVAGSPNALITISAEAESNTAGITSVKIVLPAGIVFADVTLASAPPGWALNQDADGYVVGGPPLPVNRDARHQIRVRQLPMTPTLVLKTLVNYTNGQVDRWIEVPQPGAAEPANPAPVATLAAPPGGFQAPAPSVSSPAQSAAASVSPSDPKAGASTIVAPPLREADSDASPLPWLLGGVGVVLVAALAGLYFLRRRGTSSP